VHAGWLANEEGRVIEYTRTTMVRERAVWAHRPSGCHGRGLRPPAPTIQLCARRQHRRQHKAYLDWLKDDDEIPPLATGAVVMTATALWTRANAALVVEKQRAKLGMT
jgi:hypothetical protein